MRDITSHLDLAAGAQIGGDVVGADFVNLITGTEANDELYGSDQLNDKILGLGGDDYLYGDLGDDTLVGGDGDDNLQGAGGDDSLSGGKGDETLNGGSGHDTLNGGGGQDRAVMSALGSTGVSIDLSGFVAGQTITYTYDSLGDSAKLVGVETIAFYGTRASDSIMGAEGDNHLVTEGGNDFVDGRGGIDLIDDYDGDSTLLGGAGDDVVTIYDHAYLRGPAASHDTVDGGIGNDTLVIDWSSYVTSPVTMSVDHGHILVSSADGQYGVDAVGFENYGIGVSAASTLTGGDGDDSLYGGSTGDGPGSLITGGDGDDTLSGGTGNDTLSAGAGIDTYVLSYGVYDSDTGGALFDASGFKLGTGTSVFNDNGGGLDTVSGFDNLAIDVFSQGNDTAIGTAGDDVINDYYGTDSMSGGDGDDTFVQANIYINAQQGEVDANDTFDGGAGKDTLSFAHAFYSAFDTTGWLFDLGAGTVTGQGAVFSTGVDTIKGIEHIIASGASDTILGSKAAEVLEGGFSGDTISGGGGKDQLYGGDGADTFVYSALSDSSAAKSDKILDLTDADLIDLSAIDADSHAPGDQAFALVGAFTHHASELTLTRDGKATILAGDVDGDGVADFSVSLKGDHHDFSNFVL